MREIQLAISFDMCDFRDMQLERCVIREAIGEICDQRSDIVIDEVISQICNQRNNQKNVQSEKGLVMRSVQTGYG